jgi:hypothetical protein
VFKMLSRALIAPTLLLSFNVFSAEEPDYIVGRVFEYGGGSGGGSFAVSIDMRVKSRSTVELSFLVGDVMWSLADKETLDEQGNPNQIVQFMLNCNRKTFSEYDSEHQTNVDLTAYRSGTALKWDEYDAQAVSIYPMYAGKPLLPAYFDEVCGYTNKF